MTMGPYSRTFPRVLLEERKICGVLRTMRGDGIGFGCDCCSVLWMAEGLFYGSSFMLLKE